MNKKIFSLFMTSVMLATAFSGCSTQKEEPKKETVKYGNSVNGYFYIPVDIQVDSSDSDDTLTSLHIYDDENIYVADISAESFYRGEVNYTAPRLEDGTIDLDVEYPDGCTFSLEDYRDLLAEITKITLEYNNYTPSFSTFKTTINNRDCFGYTFVVEEVYEDDNGDEATMKIITRVYCTDDENNYQHIITTRYEEGNDSVNGTSLEDIVLSYEIGEDVRETNTVIENVDDEIMADKQE